MVESFIRALRSSKLYTSLETSIHKVHHRLPCLIKIQAAQSSRSSPYRSSLPLQHLLLLPSHRQGSQSFLAITNQPKFAPAVPSARVTELKPTKGSLRVSDAAFKTISSYIEQLRPLVEDRAHHHRAHDIIARRVNDNRPPTRVIETPPAQPNNYPYEREFLTAYKEQARIAAIHLSSLLINEHAKQVGRLNKEISTVKEQAVEALYLIIDGEEQERAHTLFKRKVDGLSRYKPHQSRRILKGKRRSPQSAE